MSTNYNPRALRGESYSDSQFQADMLDMGIRIPDEQLNTPQMHVTVAAQVREMNKEGLMKRVNPNTGLNYTVEEAEQFANTEYEHTLRKMSALSGTDLTAKE